MYIIDFFKHLLRRSNFPLIFYLILNTLIVSALLGFMISPNPGIALLVGLCGYLISLAIALSPLGEYIVRKQTKCTEIKDPDVINTIEPIFREVLKKARKANPSIPEDIQLYINDSQEVNAFATGRKTVCITEGLLYEDPAIIKATLGHEMGHLSHHDTDLILVVTVGNMIVNVFFMLFRFGARVVQVFAQIMAVFSKGDDGNVAASLLFHLSAAITDIILVALMNVWTKIGTMLVLKSGRDNEYEADEFSFNLGYGYPLCKLLDSFESTKQKGLFANLMSSHPDKNDRIQRLVNLGVPYKVKNT